MEKFVLVPYTKYQRLLEPSGARGKDTVPMIGVPPGKRLYEEQKPKKRQPEEAKSSVKWISF